ncbi:MAG: cytochrome c3 family protein [Nitrospirota bacterium]|nr:cytochrome c3 family protein [Nitrospirota bacterium]
MNYRYSALALLLALIPLVGCSLESRINRNYVPSLQLLDQLQPVRDVKPAKRECDTCHKLFDMRSRDKFNRYFPVRISHKQHAKLGIDCTFCHRTATSSSDAADYLMPTGHADAVQPDAYSLQAQPADGNACKACHIHYSDFEKNDPRMPARCETCHLYYQPGKELPFMRVSRQGIKNDHKVHADNNITCIRCHVGIDLLEQPVAQFMPKMNICMECHDLPAETMRAAVQSAAKGNDDWFRRAEHLYSINCSPCHGRTGRGDGPMTAFFKADLQPRDHTDSSYIGEKSDEMLFAAIWNGGKEVNRSVRMPAFEGLVTEDDAHLLVRYIRWLSQTPSTTTPTSSLPSPG